MKIRRADAQDITSINRLLSQVLNVHHKDRPDIFRANCKKYTDAQLLELLSDDSRPVFVCTKDDAVLGYAFCIITQNSNHNILTDIKTLYIDDLCVDESVRGQHIGTLLYDYVIFYF